MSVRILLSYGSRSQHLQPHPAVGDVVLTLDDPIESRVILACHAVLDGVAHQLVVRVDDRRKRAQELLKRLCELPHLLAGARSRVLTGRPRLVRRVDGLERFLPGVAARLDLTRRVVVLHDIDPHVLARVGGVVAVDLALAEHHDAAAPVEAVLVEVIRCRLFLSGTLVVGERVGLPLLAEHVQLKFGGALQPTFKISCEMGLRHVEPGRGRRGRGRGRGGRRAATATTASAVFLAELHRGSRREVGLDRDERDHRGRGRPVWVEQDAVPLRVERHRDVVVAQGGCNEHVRVAGPGPPVRRHGEVELQRDRCQSLAVDLACRYAGVPRDLVAGVAPVRAEKALEVELVLAEWRRIELCLDVRTERRMRERARQVLRQCLGCRLQFGGERSRRRFGSARGWARRGRTVAARHQGREGRHGRQDREIARFMGHNWLLFVEGLRAQHEESVVEHRRPIYAPPVEITRHASPSERGACSFPIPMTPMIPILLLLMAPDTAGYWQQRAAYHITAALDEPAGVLLGHARITYVNRSPDTLRDFFVHPDLNALRPGSRWAAADAAEGRVRFPWLRDPDYAFERITDATVMGERARPDYPYAPDSTIAHWPLPRPLAPGASGVVEIDWRGRPSATPRRPGGPGGRPPLAPRGPQ